LGLAQQGTALSGTVTDISGAVIPGASVVVHSASGGVQAQTVSDGEGGFRFASLAAGDYTITANATGFSPARQNIPVSGQSVALHLILAVAAASETVEVSSNSIGIDPSSTTTGGALDEHAVEAVPLNGRSFTDMLAFAPGVVPVSSAQPSAVVMAGVTSTPPSGDLDAGNLSVSGQRETANGFAVNGSDVVEDVNMGTVIVPILTQLRN